MTQDLTPEQAADQLVAALERAAPGLFGKPVAADNLAGCCLLELIAAVDRARPGMVVAHMAASAFMLGMHCAEAGDAAAGLARLLKQRVNEGLRDAAVQDARKASVH